MTREAFIEILDRKGYPYEIEGDKIVVSYQWTVNLESLKKLPSGVEFNNGGDVWLHSLKTLHPGVEFKNNVWVSLEKLDTRNFTGIEGIDNRRLLNLMISKGVFER